MEPGSATDNFHPRNLLFRGRLQPLQLFARNHVPVTITQLEDEQVQSRSCLIFHAGHKRPTAHFLGALNSAIDFGVATDDPVFCHENPQL